MTLGLKQRPRLLLLFVALAAGAVWGRWLWPDPGGGENALRRTGGLEATVLSVDPDPNGRRVLCRIVNRGSRTAEQVVLKVGLADAHGGIAAENPLASVAELTGGESREAAFQVPLQRIEVSVSGTVEVSLVRWRD